MPPRYYEIDQSGSSDAPLHMEGASDAHHRRPSSRAMSPYGQIHLQNDAPSRMPHDSLRRDELVPAPSRTCMRWPWPLRPRLGQGQADQAHGIAAGPSRQGLPSLPHASCVAAPLLHRVVLHTCATRKTSHLRPKT
jgi:hypothetical protein